MAGSREDSSERSRRGFMSAVAGAGIAGVVGWTVVSETKTATEQFKSQCDDAFGQAKWVLVPANESERSGLYIGQEYVCLHENSTRAENNDT